MTPSTPTMAVKSGLYFDCVTECDWCVIWFFYVGISRFSIFGLDFDGWTD